MFFFLQAQPNIGGLSEATVRTAYEKLAGNDVAKYLVGIVTVIAIIIMVSEIITVYQKNHTKEGFDRKGFFDMMKLYARYVVFIGALPFIIYGLETALAEVQDNITAKYNTSLEKSGTQAIAQFVGDYIREEVMPPEDATLLEKGLDVVNKQLNPIKRIQMRFQVMGIGLYMICIYILKYIYFFFCLGRYTWLLMLQVIAPVAVILALHKETRNYFYAWVKNMIICYLLIPFFIMADALAETVIKVVTDSMDISVYGVFAVLGMVFIKVGLFGYVTKRAYSLM